MTPPGFRTLRRQPSLLLQLLRIVNACVAPNHTWQLFLSLAFLSALSSLVGRRFQR
jgi:hypothetical protein